MKRTSLGCGVMVFLVLFVGMAYLLAWSAVFSYYVEYENRNPQTEDAITKELWLQKMVNHPFAPPCYTLDAALCTTAEQVRVGSSSVARSDFGYLIEVSAAPALVCGLVIWAILAWSRWRRVRRQTMATPA